MRKNLVAVCPCCGFKFEGLLANGCESCGAVPVGEALPRPDHELPSFGRSLLLLVVGLMLILTFLTQTIIAYVQKAPASISFWSLTAAAETAAWRMKWLAIPITIVVLWALRKLYRSVIEDPTRFCGLRYARAGFLASAFVPVLIAVLIGVTVPDRLMQRQYRLAAEVKAPALTLARAVQQYQLEFGTFPSDIKDLTRLPDPDGSIAAALANPNLDVAGYKATADLAALPTKKPRPLRGSVIMNASIGSATDDLPSEGLSFTNYELPLAGQDKVFGTEDDLIVRDGVIFKVSEVRQKIPKTAPRQ
ncbi:MAG TPA: hypothetical protein VJS64_00685 [Pyrinomonadaceae bacterium]|nr:hypothetical protein [Pyrinomonadaceae bacterium]